MSDSDSDLDYGQPWFHKCFRSETFVTFKPSDEILDRFSLIPVETKKEAVQRMKICAFWLPTLLQPDRFSNTLAWAIDIGMKLHGDDLSLENIDVVETVERILDSLEKASMHKVLLKHIITLSNMFNLHSPHVLEEAMAYLEQLADLRMCDFMRVFWSSQAIYIVLSLIFTEFAKYIQEMGLDLEKTMRSLMHKPSDYQLEKSEEMKMRGNRHFQKQDYKNALKFYTEAIRFYPDNHILYGNRALCYIRSKKYLKAVGDGKCATLIKPLWAKGHYRYAEALFCLGQTKRALTANSAGLRQCKDDHEGMKDLEQQQQKFREELSNANVPTTASPMKSSCKRSVSVDRQTGETKTKKSAPKVSVVKGDKQSAKNDKTAQKPANAKDPKPSNSDSASKNAKVESDNAAKKKSKNKKTDAGDKNETENTGAVLLELKSAVLDAHTALVDLRSRNAEQGFSQALALLERTTLKEVGLSKMDVLLLMFGRASALTDIGQPEELTEAQKVLEKIKSYEERVFQCLVYYTYGRVYLQENRFTVALEQFSNSLQMVKNKITPGKLTWPFTKELVKETQPQYFKEILESTIELCRFPPAPDAICRMENCSYPMKAEIFFTDPDFKGFIQMCCCQSCKVEYHITCWKSLKTSAYNEKSEKDFLQEPCLTPDCVGFICKIKIYGPTGLVKCKFEAAIPKPQALRKPKVNQKCTSQKKLKSKEERKAKRKQHKQSLKENQSFNEEILQEKKPSASQTQQKAWLLYRDRALLQISQKLDLLKEETSLQVLDLTRCLKPWLELDSSRGNQVAARILNWQEEQLNTVGQVLELLLERRNRVWARVFVHHLSSCTEMNPKLSSWACQLDDAGLQAAQSFIGHHAEHLEQLDLALLLNFGPLQERIIEKLGARPELFSSIGLTVTEYLKQAPPHDMRLFIWTLEEHREDYVSCQAILDEYFDMMDGHCSVLKKSDENNSPMKTKNRGRKKKSQKVGYPMRSVTPRDEWTHDYIEEDSLSFLHPADPFNVPYHLRNEVAEFEELYYGTEHESPFKLILDNNPDPTKETLYDYFAQILDEHGPLLAEDPLLVGELPYFPPDAQNRVQECGGFEAFLLDSLRFIKIGRCIGLARHAVALQQCVPGVSLDVLDEIADPNDVTSFNDFKTDMNTDFTSSLDNFHFDNISRVLPNPHAREFQPMGTYASYAWGNSNDQQTCNASSNQYEEDLYTCEPAVEVVDGYPCADKQYLKVDAAVQTCLETMRSVAVNTELYERYEKHQGDIVNTDKMNMKLEKDIQKMMDDVDQAKAAKREEITALEGDIQNINANITVTNQELLLFQQKLEEEVKKDQKEKKANQETLKALKQEIDVLLEEQSSLTRSIRENKASYDTKLSDFLHVSNQSAAEKMSMEDEIKRYKALLTSATQRSRSTQLVMAEIGRDQGLYDLRRELTDSKELLGKMDEALLRSTNQELERTRNQCRNNVEELKKRISNIEQEYREQMDQVKNGSRVNELPPVNIQNRPGGFSQPADSPVLAAAPASRSTPPLHPLHPLHPLVEHAAAQRPAPARRVDSPSRATVFDKAMERLASMFPDYQRPHLMKFLQEFRSSCGGSLSSLTLQGVVSGTTQRILDHQEKLSAARANASAQRTPAVTPPPTVWQPVPPPVPQKSGLNMDDPCIICHEDMSPHDTCILECRHSFHDECIRSWLKEQSTCPTCRTHALLNDDFPALSHRRRL